MNNEFIHDNLVYLSHQAEASGPLPPLVSLHRAGCRRPSEADLEPNIRLRMLSSAHSNIAAAEVWQGGGTGETASLMSSPCPPSQVSWLCRNTHFTYGCSWGVLLGWANAHRSYGHTAKSMQRIHEWQRLPVHRDLTTMWSWLLTGHLGHVLDFLSLPLWRNKDVEIILGITLLMNRVFIL